MEIIYEHRGKKLVKTPEFVYESILYLIYKDRVECIGNKFFSSKSELKYKDYEEKIINKTCKQVKYTEFIGAPEEYLNKNGYRAYEYHTKREIEAAKRAAKKVLN